MVIPRPRPRGDSPIATLCALQPLPGERARPATHSFSDESRAHAHTMISSDKLVTEPKTYTRGVSKRRPTSAVGHACQRCDAGQQSPPPPPSPPAVVAGLCPTRRGGGGLLVSQPQSPQRCHAAFQMRPCPDRGAAFPPPECVVWAGDGLFVSVVGRHGTLRSHDTDTTPAMVPGGQRGFRRLSRCLCVRAERYLNPNLRKIHAECLAGIGQAQADTPASVGSRD
jgi:hypothetical protein